MLALFKSLGRKAHNDVPSFEQVFNEHYDYVVRLAYNLSGNLSDAEDIAQEVFIGVNASLARFEGKSQLRTWIYRIVIRVACRYLSKKTTTVSFDDVKHENDGDGEVPQSDDFDILKLMLKLPLEQRTLISLSAIEGLSHQQIADILNVPVGTIGSRLHTARRQLMKLMT